MVFKYGSWKGKQTYLQATFFALQKVLKVK